MKTLICSLTLASFAFAQDKPKDKEVKPTPPTAEERLALMESQRNAILADNALRTLMNQYYEAQAKAKAAADKWNADLQAATKKSGCQFTESFQCAPVQTGAVKSAK